MKVNALLTAAAIYLLLIGLGMVLVPRYFGIGAVPPDASSELIAFLRIFGGPCLGIATLNWLIRNHPPSRTRDAVVIGNLVGFACVALSDVIGVTTGASRPIAKLFLILHAGFAIAFVLAWRRHRLVRA